MANICVHMMLLSFVKRGRVIDHVFGTLFDFFGEGSKIEILYINSGFELMIK